MNVRGRIVRPGFFDNEQLAEVDPLGRILFIGLWCLADKEGRLEDRPRRVKTKVLPYDDCDVDALIDQLAQREFVIRYEHEGQRFIQIVNFVKHQKPHHKEDKSVIPAPPGYPQHSRLSLPDSIEDIEEEVPEEAEEPEEITPLPVNGRVMLAPSSEQAQANNGPSMDQARVKHESTLAVLGSTSVVLDSTKSPDGPLAPLTRTRTSTGTRTSTVTGTRNPETTAHARARVVEPGEDRRKDTRSGRVIDLIRAGGFEPNLLDRHHKLLNKDCDAAPELIAEAYLAAARGQWNPGGRNFLRDNLSIEAVVSRLDGFVAWKQSDSHSQKPSVATAYVPARSNGTHVQGGPTESDRSVAKFLSGRSVPSRTASLPPEDFASFKAPF